MNLKAALLAVSGIVVRYGAITAVRGIDLEVRDGEIVALVGPNGAGKTSLLSAIAGIVAPLAGSLLLRGEPLVHLRLEEVCRRGIALVPEGRHIFSTLTVQENLLLGATIRNDSDSVAAEITKYFSMFPILRERRKQPAGQLSGGEQQQLAIARALLSRPRLLMLDEPSLGLAPTVVDRVYDLLRSIRDEGVSILLVEQNAGRAFALADRAYVMSGGVISLRGTPAELSANPLFDAAYFGIEMRDEQIAL
jgi:branched-chain amino acid transport system ATP-binding protein